MDDARTREVEHSDLYVNHLYLAAYARRWADRVRQDVHHEPQDAEYLGGYAQAVADIALHLAEGVGLPGGPIYRAISRDVAVERMAPGLV